MYSKKFRPIYLPHLHANVPNSLSSYSFEIRVSDDTADINCEDYLPASHALQMSVKMPAVKELLHQSNLSVQVEPHQVHPSITKRVVCMRSSIE